MPIYKNLKLEEFEKQLMNDSEAVILDTRTNAEYRSGHLQNAINIPNIKENLTSLDPEKHYYVHCRSGGRSAIASQILSRSGFKYVYNLNDYIENTNLLLVKSNNLVA